MLCPRCGRTNDEHVDYCAFCGAGMGRRSGNTGRLDPVEDTRSFQTEVLTEFYGDYLDTVVDPVASFDPSIFPGTTQAGQSIPAGSSAAQPPLSPQPAWSNAATTSVAQVAAAPALAVKPNAAAQSGGAQYGAAQPGGVSYGVATGFDTSGGYAPSPSASASDDATWVLGAPPSSFERTEVPLVGQANQTPFAQRSTQSATYGTVQMPASSQVQAAPTPPAYASGPATSPWQVATRPSPHLPLEEKKEPNLIAIGLAIALAVIAVVAATVAVITFFGPKDSGTTNKGNTATVVVPASSSSASSTSDETTFSGKSATTTDETEKEQNSGTEPVPYDPAPKKTGFTDQEFYEELVKAYDAAGDYDERVADCARDFNNNYMNESKQLRSSKASVASNLKANIRSDWDALKNLKSRGFPLWSNNKDAYEQLLECYECLWNRIDVIDRSWSNSLKYDTKEDLEKHQEEILAPIAANKVNGNDKYFTRFKELYPTIRITKP